jgi:hypothetical protein
MHFVNIVKKPYRDYVRVHCDDNATMRNEILDALDTLWAHPDGQKKIIQSWDRKGTLDIEYSKIFSSNGYATNRHAVRLSPIPSLLQNDQAEQYKTSLLETLAHEIYHAHDSDFIRPVVLSFDGGIVQKNGIWERQEDGFYRRAELAVFHAYEQIMLTTH